MAWIASTPQQPHSHRSSSSIRHKQQQQQRRMRSSRRYTNWSGVMVIFAMQRFTTTSAFSTYSLVRKSGMQMLAADSRELRFYARGLSAASADRSFAILENPSAVVEPMWASVAGSGPGRPEGMKLGSASASSFSTSSLGTGTNTPFPSFGPYDLSLSEEEKELFDLLHQVTEETELSSNLRVAGGWVRDKLLATPEFQISANINKSVPGKKVERLTSKYQSSAGPQPSMGRQGTKVLMDDAQSKPVDIDIALDDMLGREFADHLNEWLEENGQETHSVGVVLKNPEKSKHLETATMKVGTFWIDFVNLRAEEYTQDSRIPDLMRIGTAAEDAFRRDLTINALFYNINTGQVEDWTGRGFDDLKRGIVATPLAPLTTLLDDPLRVLRSVRFAARLRFAMDDALIEAAKDERVRDALGQKVSRERVGGEVDLMLRSLDPVGAMRLLCNLNLVGTVFSIENCLPEGLPSDHTLNGGKIFSDGLTLLSITHDHLCDCQRNPPVWCEAKRALKTITFGADEQILMENEKARRLLWYASFLKPLMDYSKLPKQVNIFTPPPKRQGRKANRSVIQKLLVDELKRPTRDADSVERIMKAADDFTRLINSGCDLSAMAILMSEVKVEYSQTDTTFTCSMDNQPVDPESETHPVWIHAMEFRLLCSKVLQRVGSLWRAALFLSLSEQLVALADDLDYAIEGDVIEEVHEEYKQGVLDKYNAFAAALQQMGMIGIWDQKPLIDGKELKNLLPSVPKGPVFREIMDEQENWLISHPGGGKEALTAHLKEEFPEYL